MMPVDKQAQAKTLQEAEKYPPLTEAFAELRKIARGAYDDLDPVEYVNRMRNRNDDAD